MTRLPASPQHAFDVLIIGSGLAGLTAALLLAPGRRVAVVTKRELNDGSSAWAQGGMAAVLAEGDTLEQHVNDTLIAGAGLCDLPATRRGRRCARGHRLAARPGRGLFRRQPNTPASCT
jgi:L-aspartate oxidase